MRPRARARGQSLTNRMVMDTSDERAMRSKSAAASFARGALWLAWQVVRLPVFAFLVILEPIVRLVLSSAALLGVLTAFLFEFSGAAPDFPFWGMLAISVGCMLALMAYYALLSLLS